MSRVSKVIIAAIFSVLLVIYLSTNVLASDFDKFSKQLIRELGHRASSEIVTEAIQKYMRENSVNDFDRFFQKNMDVFSARVTLDDPDLTQSDKSLLKKAGAESLTVFTRAHPT